MVFACVTCIETFSKDDVKQGLYFPSISRCLNCLTKAKKDPKTCFGKREKYNPATIACGEECPERKVCKVFIKLK